jgi:hypothetical protein
MMLGFIYVVLTAKPISIRRLCLLYVVGWASARFLLAILRIEPSASLAVELATTIALLVWVSPFVRLLFRVLQGRRATPEVFETVSACVQFTYGFILVMLPVGALETWLTVSHAPMRASLTPAIAWASLGGGVFVMMVQRFSIAPPWRAADGTSFNEKPGIR